MTRLHILLRLAAAAVALPRRLRLYRESREHIARLYDPSRYPF